MCLLIPAVLMSIGTYLFKACSVSPLNTTPSFSGFPNSLTVDSDKGNLTLFCVLWAHLQSSVFKLSKDLIDSIHEEGIVAYTS